MTHAMTAFASRTGQMDGASWHWDLRGLNGRGLDIRTRLPDGMDRLDQTLRTALGKALHRGSVTVTLRLTRSAQDADLALDEAQLDRVLRALDRVQERAYAAGVTLAQPTAADVLATRGVIGGAGDQDDDTGLFAALCTDIGPLLSDFTAMRAHEGAALQHIVADQLDRIKVLTADARAAATARQPRLRQSLRDAYARIMEVTAADDARLVQELAILTTRQDVTEELDRLDAHVAAAWDIIEDDAPAGRRLDFLSQEFMREANTLCAKSQDSDLTQVGLALKLVIDQLREQIQNVE
ncbi:TIGR00255 family protein [Loktanella fryxellensis]|uniref:TIGR00255 family protein n=1 Tax=Loktanella fryxellensis TaxID=245187 RepID=A0A1H8FBJ1_9RHOB|nr:YicC/YloC family endoribonuclease [Loktanella fryxellensis]SEN29079.1 TIGR00255 family protein [Loktanella fryxellensis]